MDIFIAVFIILGFILGFKDGIIRKIVGFIGFVAAIYLSIKFAEPFGHILNSIFGLDGYLADLVGGLVIYSIVTVLVIVAKRWVHPHDKVNNIFNQLLGGIVGSIQVLYFLSAIFLILNIFSIPNQKTRSKSIFYTKVSEIVPNTVKIINDKLFQQIKEQIGKKSTTEN